MDSVLEYILPFWNSVDLRFRLLEAPKVRLNIAGIVIATVSDIYLKYLDLLKQIIALLRNLLQDPDVFSFFNTSYVTANMMSAASALNSLSEYMYQVKSKFPFNSYDIAVAITS